MAALLRSPSFIAVLANTVLLLAAAGVLFYTRVLFHRPPITEDAERERLEKLTTLPAPVMTPGLIYYEPFTANIAPNPQPLEAKTGDTSAAPAPVGKLHFVTLGFAFEVNDMAKKELVDEIRPRFQDQLLSLLGKKSFQELTTVQGRYVLREQMLSIINQLTAKSSGTPVAPEQGRIVTRAFFTQFVVQ